VIPSGEQLIHAKSIAYWRTTARLLRESFGSTKDRASNNANSSPIIRLTTTINVD
jgi:hypothetical protein